MTTNEGISADWGPWDEETPIAADRPDRAKPATIIGPFHPDYVWTPCGTQSGLLGYGRNS